MLEAVSSKKRAGGKAAVFAALCLAVLFTSTAPRTADAQTTFLPTGDFLTTPLNISALLGALQGNAANITQFDNIAEPVPATPPATGTVGGGQAMLDAIVGAIQTNLGIQVTTPPIAVAPNLAPEELNISLTSITTSGGVPPAADPAKFTVASGTYVNGETVVLSGTGIPALDGVPLTIANVSGTTFELQNGGVSIDFSTPALPAYSGGGTLTTPAIDLVNKAAAGDMPSISKLQGIFADPANNWFAPYGYQPPPPPAMVAVPNIGMQALGFMLGGTGNISLQIIALAATCTYTPVGNAINVVCPTPEATNAQATLAQIFDYCGQNTTGNGLVPTGGTCNQDRSPAFLLSLQQVMLPFVQTDPVLCTPNPSPQACTPHLDLIIQAVIAAPTGTLAQNLSNAIAHFLMGITPCPPALSSNPELCLGAADPTNLDSYIGPAAVAYLGNLFQNITVQGTPYTGGPLPVPQPPGSASTTTPPAPPNPAALANLKVLPVPGGGVHMIPSPGANVAPMPCSGSMDSPEGPDYVVENIKIQYAEDGSSATFGTNPCIFTRDKLSLDFAQNFQAGQQWAAYFPAWVQQQWMPALRAMAAQWSAVIIAQGVMMSSAVDANGLTKTATMIQQSEAEAKTALAPSEQVCVGGSAAYGSAVAQYQVGAMSAAFRHNFEVHAGLGIRP